MELQFKQTEQVYYESRTLPSFSCETMRETIVPDSCADIARIIDAMGQVYLISRDVSEDGRISVSGTVDVSVLYIPEKGEGPRALHLALPFQCYSEGIGAGEWSYLDVRPAIRSVESRLLNPRKILTKADIVLYPTACAHIKRCLCTGADVQGPIQTLRKARLAQIVETVREREFLFGEELSLPPGQKPMAELLNARGEIHAEEGKLIGNKLVVKGLLRIHILYRDEEGQIGYMRQDVPFSQVLDGTGVEEQMEVHTVCRLMGLTCRLGSDSGGDEAYTATVEAQLLARSVVWSQREIEFLADLYSTQGEIQCEREDLELDEPCQQKVLRGNVRETLETATAVKTVLDTRVRCLDVIPTGRDITVSIRAQCLYLDENDSLGSTGRTLQAVCPADFAEGSRLLEVRGEAQEQMVSIVPDGVELRFPIECTVMESKRQRASFVSGGTWEETGEEEKRPSVVLRKFQKGETLWSAAKQYRTTTEEIAHVNGLENGQELPQGRVLLIPRKR